MTWSIIARDSSSGQFGIAVATRFFAVGARVPYVAAGHGGIATQALINPYYGIDGLKLLREGRLPRDIVETLIAAEHPIRAIKRLCDEALRAMHGHFDEIYAADGAPSIPPELASPA